MSITRRRFLGGTACAGAALFMSTYVNGRRVVYAVDMPETPSLNPGDIAEVRGRRC